MLEKRSSDDEIYQSVETTIMLSYPWRPHSGLVLTVDM